MSFARPLLVLMLLGFAPARAELVALPRLLPAVPAPLSANLAALKTEPFAALRPGELFHPGLEAALIEQFPRWAKISSPHRLISGQPLRESPELARAIDGFESELAAKLRRVLPGERFELDRVQVHLALGETAKLGTQPHVDSGYLTATYSLFAPGTSIFLPDFEGNAVQELQAFERSLVVISNLDRERALRRPVGVVHSAPRGLLDKRLLLLLHYVSSARLSGHTPDSSRRISFVERALSSK